MALVELLLLTIIFLYPIHHVGEILAAEGLDGQRIGDLHAHLLTASGTDRFRKVQVTFQTRRRAHQDSAMQDRLSSVLWFPAGWIAPPPGLSAYTPEPLASDQRF